MASGGAEGIRTPDPLLAKQVLSQLSYGPTAVNGGQGSIAAPPATSRCVLPAYARRACPGRKSRPSRVSLTTW